MSLVVLAAIGCAFAVVGVLLPDPPRTYRIGISHFPPFMIADGGVSPSGFAVDVVKEAARRRGIALEWVTLNNGPAQAFAEGKIDLYPLFAQTSQKRAGVYVTQPWWENSVALVVDKSKPFHRAQDLMGRRIALVRDSIAAGLARSDFPGSSFIDRITYEDVLRTVCSGDSDAAFLAVHLFEDLLQQRVSGCENTRLGAVLVPDATILYGVGALPQASAAADRIAAEIGKMAFDGSMAQIGARSGVLVSHEAKLFRSLIEERSRASMLLLLVIFLGLLIALFAWQNSRVQLSRRAAERALRAEAEFLANMSHEIRTPMNGVLGMLAMALETELDSEQFEYLETANHSALSLMSVLNDILDFSKIDAGRLELEHIEFSPARVAAQCLKTLQQEAEKKHLAVKLEISGDVPDALIGDPNRLRQVILNLLGNAIKFTERGAVTVRLHRERSDPGSTALHFSVSDTGIGIPPEKQRKIFQPFSQADQSTSRKFGGTGLGLTISARLVELMGGRIWVESTPNQGSTFHFTAVFDCVPVPVPV